MLEFHLAPLKILTCAVGSNGSWSKIRAQPRTSGIAPDTCNPGQTLGQISVAGNTCEQEREVREVNVQWSSWEPGMTIQNGGRDGKSKNGLRLVHGSRSEVVSLTDIPKPIAESLRQQCSEEIAVLFRRANVSPALIYTFSKTGLLVTEENRDRLPPAEYREWKQALRD